MLGIVPNAASALIAKIPPLTVVVPVNVLLPLNATVPV